MLPPPNALDGRFVNKAPEPENVPAYIVLATVALTGVFVAASHRIHSNFNQHLRQIHQTAAR